MIAGMMEVFEVMDDIFRKVFWKITHGRAAKGNLAG